MRAHKPKSDPVSLITWVHDRAVLPLQAQTLSLMPQSIRDLAFRIVVQDFTPVEYTGCVRFYASLNPKFLLI